MENAHDFGDYEEPSRGRLAVSGRLAPVLVGKGLVPGPGLHNAARRVPGLPVLGAVLPVPGVPGSRRRVRGAVVPAARAGVAVVWGGYLPGPGGVLLPSGRRIGCGGASGRGNITERHTETHRNGHRRLFLCGVVYWYS